MIVSGAFGNGNGWPITPPIFQDSMSCFAARKLVIQSWLNDSDQFSVPDLSHPEYAQWSFDSIIWSLFHTSNQTSSLGDMIYKGQVYDLPNHFYWMSPSEMMEIDGLPPSIWQQCQSARPRFVSSWLLDHQEEFCEDAWGLLEMAKGLVRVSAQHRMNALRKFQLDRWDSGWYQISRGLFGKDVPFQPSPGMLEMMREFEVQHKTLGDRLRPMIYDLGFLPRQTLLD